MKKYELLTNDTVTSSGKPIYRIRACRDFGNVKSGDLGGYIETENNLSHEGDCWVADNACVYGNARVSGNAWIADNACVCGNARVFDNARVIDNACVGGNACVFDNAWLMESAQVGGNATVCDNAKMFDSSQAAGDALVDGNSRLNKNMYVDGNGYDIDDTEKQQIKKLMGDKESGYKSRRDRKMMINTVKALYEAIYENDDLIISEEEERTNDIIDTYIDPVDKEKGLEGTSLNGEVKLFDLLSLVRYGAFETGYKTALQLVIPSLYGDTAAKED